MLKDVKTGKFYFLEVNTRKQVEIFVTEHQDNKDYVSS
jgi:acetyl/propionyl-CoA carboxylase alpha subunit